MNYTDVTQPERIEGDENNFSDSAFRRAKAVCDHGDVENSQELQFFLKSEQEECVRRAAWERTMQKYYDENAATAFEMEAKAFGVMLSRLKQEG